MYDGAHRQDHAGVGAKSSRGRESSLGGAVSTPASLGAVVRNFAGYSTSVHRVAVLWLGMLVLTGCAAAAAPRDGRVVAAVAPVEGGEPHEVVQGTVTRVDTDRVHVDVRIVWAPVLRADNRTVEVSVGPVTRFVPAAFRSRLQPGDEVQVSLAAGQHDHPHAQQITVLDLD